MTSLNSELRIGGLLPHLAGRLGRTSLVLALVAALRERPSVWDEIQQELQTFEGADGFVGPCEMLVAVGIK